jgi:exopolysaccharide production protein ExoZ
VIQNLQTLRIFFMFWVVVAHMKPLFFALGVDDGAFALGRIAIDGFLVVTGFLLAYSQLRKPRSPAAFFWHRMARLAPFYWVVTLAVAALALAAPGLFKSTVVTPETLLKSLLFIPYQKGSGVTQPIVFVGWTMNLIVAFVAVYATLFALLGKRAWLATAGLCVALVSWRYWAHPTGVFTEFYSAQGLLALALGLVLARFWAAFEKPFTAGAARWLIPGAILLGAVALLVIGLRPFFYPSVDRLLLGPFMSAMLVMAVCVLERCGWVHRGLWRDRLAAASFAVYLTHPFLTQAAVKVQDLLHIHTAGPLFMLILATLIGVVVTALAARALVELPLEKLTAALAKQWERWSARWRTPAARA